MNVAIVGSSGYIASFLLNSFLNNSSIKNVMKIDQVKSDEIEYLNLQEARYFNYDSLNDIDYIIFTAAISGPDKCTNEYEFCWSINVTGTKYFIHEALKRKCHVLFFSSDAVFGDIPGKIYDEDSLTQAKTSYGKMKKSIEDEFKNELNFKAIRLAYVVSVKDRFVSYCIQCMRNNEIADIFHPFYRNCITISDVVNVVIWLLENWDSYNHFVLNVTGKELVSRVRIADELNRYFGGRLKYTIGNPGEEFYKNRPKITQMSSLYLCKYNIIEDNSFTEKIQKELKEFEL